MDSELRSLRSHYEDLPMDLGSRSDCPIEVFRYWLRSAIASGVPEPNAMVLGTVDGKGHPRSRAVLCKGVEKEGFLFYTHWNSPKGLEIATHSQVSLNFLWLTMARQVRIEGKAFRLSKAESVAYFSTRPRNSQLSAWASAQSSVLGSREELEQAFEEAKKRFQGKAHIPCPAQWGGYRVQPHYIEFWQGRSRRLHERIAYQKHTNTWKSKLLAP